jgi:hypothetical protein
MTATSRKTTSCTEVCGTAMGLREQRNNGHYSSIRISEYQNESILCIQYLVLLTILKEINDV